MTSVVVYGFQRSTYVNIVRLVLTHKAVEFEFKDMETEMQSPAHLALHPFGRVPALRHGEFTLYETSAIVAYLDQAFPDPRLTPTFAYPRAKMNQWISAVNEYYYPQIVFCLSHERKIFPELGIEPDERIVQAALPRIERALDVMERELSAGGPFLVGDEVTLADFYMLPTMTSLALNTAEGRDMLKRRAQVSGWRERMEQLASVRRFRASLPPPAPIEHARAWATSHRATP